MLALLFPGQGSQEVGMGRDVAAASPAARAVFEAADAALSYPLSRLCFEGPEEELVRTEKIADDPVSSHAPLFATSMTTPVHSDSRIANTGASELLLCVTASLY